MAALDPRVWLHSLGVHYSTRTDAAPLVTDRLPGIRINALVAGGFDTPMLRGVFERVSPQDPLAAETGFTQAVPLGRVGRPEEAADAVLWLCSNAASYVTGHSLIVDGGMTAAFR